MRLGELANCKKDQDCYILACGPSLNKYDNEETRELLKTKLVFSVKQAYDRFKKETDFHFWNRPFRGRVLCIQARLSVCLSVTKVHILPIKGFLRFFA